MFFCFQGGLGEQHSRQLKTLSSSLPEQQIARKQPADTVPDSSLLQVTFLFIAAACVFSALLALLGLSKAVAHLAAHVL